MILNWIRFLGGTFCLAFGLFFLVSSVVGNYKFKFALNRMHAAALGDTLGLLGIVLGVALYHGFTVTTAKLLIIVVLVWITSPVASHLIMLMELSNGRAAEEVHEVQAGELYEETSDEQGLERSSVANRRRALHGSEGEHREGKGQKGQPGQSGQSGQSGKPGQSGQFGQPRQSGQSGQPGQKGPEESKKPEGNPGAAAENEGGKKQ